MINQQKELIGSNKYIKLISPIWKQINLKKNPKENKTLTILDFPTIPTENKRAGLMKYKKTKLNIVG